jgi:putative pyruvate formate lyase activating enzyme
MENDKPAKFQIAKKLPVLFNKTDSLAKLWNLHDQLTKKFYSFEKELDSNKKLLQEFNSPETSFLDLKIEIANRIMQSCHLCTRRCGSNRKVGELGYCKCGTKTIVSTIFSHTGEEPELVPSGTIFTLGCTLRCLHCQNWSISQWFETGKIYSPQQLAKAIEQLRRSGCRNVNLVGGDPTSWLNQWLETFRFVEVNVPVIWNSNSYYSKETAKLLT